MNSVYTVSCWPVADLPNKFRKTARSASPGMSFSMPTSAMCTGTGASPKRELPSLVTITMRPLSAHRKFAPVMQAWACMYFLRRNPRARRVMVCGSSL